MVARRRRLLALQRQRAKATDAIVARLGAVSIAAMFWVSQGWFKRPGQENFGFFGSLALPALSLGNSWL